MRPGKSQPWFTLTSDFAPQVLIALCMRDDSSAINAADRAWPCRRSDLRQLAECLHNGRAWGLAGPLFLAGTLIACNDSHGLP